MNNMKQTILGLFVALILMTASCSNDEKNEPTTYDPATEIAGTYLGETKVTNGTSSYSYPESTFIIRKESTGGVRYDLIQNNGKELLTNIYTTVGYSPNMFSPQLMRMEQLPKVAILAILVPVL